jgi:adenylate cyclase
MAETRKLAAILAADVVGFSRMTGADEDGTLSRLRVLRDDLVDPFTAAHNGRIFKRTGDGFLAEFRSVVDAVRCAIEVQSAMVERNVGVADDRRIDFRIGIHLGDVVEERDGDVMGEGVNIAARLEGIAKPGAICLSEQAYWQVKGRLEIAVDDLGPTRLKNIAEPVRAFCLQVGVPAQAKATSFSRPTTRTKTIPSIFVGMVVLLALVAAGGWWFLGANLRKTAQAAHLSIVALPFANLTNDPGQDYFADGVTDNLITDLSRIRNSFVIARNTAFSYKGKNVDVKAIGKDLGVRYVLEGSVQRDQNRVRVSAQLIDAQTGASRWADRFEEEVADLFKLQDQVVGRLANALGYALEKAEAEKSASAQNPDVVDLVMRARAVNYKLPLTKDENEKARGLFEQALALDPTDLDAIDGVALSYLFDLSYGWITPGIDYGAKIIGACDRIIAADPSYASASD